MPVSQSTSLQIKMADPYSMVGEPTDVRIAGNQSKAKIPIYAYRSVFNSGSIGGTMPPGGRGGGVSQMMAAPTPGDLFHPSSSEPASERKLSASQLLYNYIDRSALPGTTVAEKSSGSTSLRTTRLPASSSTCMPL